MTPEYNQSGQGAYSGDEEEQAAQLARYEFKVALDRIRSHSGRATEMISLYVPPDKAISDVSNYLRNEFSQSSNIKSKSTKKNVTAAIESILSRIKVYRKPPDNGVVFFVGHVSKGADQTTMVQEVVEPPEAITTFYYRCDNGFYLDPLEDMLEDKELYGLMVIDRSEATLGLLKGSRIITLKNMGSQVPSKHGQGGQSQRRFERLIEIAAHDYYKRVADHAEEVFRDYKLKGLIVGGPGSTKDYFIKQEYLHHELRKLLMDTFDTGYTDDSGLRELVENAKTTLARARLVQEKQLMERFIKQVIKSDGGLSSYGEAQVRSDLELGAVEILLISDQLPAQRVQMNCENCGFSHTGKPPETEEPVCPSCGQAITLSEAEDLVKEFSKLAEASRTAVELISTESEQGDLLLRAFGGVAAILRYKTTSI